MKKLIILSLMFMSYFCALLDELWADQSQGIPLEVIRQAAKKIPDHDIKILKFFNMFQERGLIIVDIDRDKAFLKIDSNVSSAPNLQFFVSHLLARADTNFEMLTVSTKGRSFDEKKFLEVFGSSKYHVRKKAEGLYVIESISLGDIRDVVNREPRLAEEMHIEEFMVPSLIPMSPEGFKIIKGINAPLSQTIRVAGKKKWYDVFLT